MVKQDTSSYKTFDDIATRLDEIIGQVRDKDTSLERSLDLFDEAIALGSKAVDLVDTTELSASEKERLAKSKSQDKAGSTETAKAEDSAEAEDSAPADSPKES